MLDPDPDLEEMSPETKHSFLCTWYNLVSTCRRLLLALQAKDANFCHMVIWSIRLLFLSPPLPPPSRSIYIHLNQRPGSVSIVCLTIHGKHMGGWSNERIFSLWEIKNRFLPRFNNFFPLDCVFYCCAEREILEWEQKGHVPLRCDVDKRLAALTVNAKVTTHCTENHIYVFPEMKLRGLVPNSYIHVSVSNL